MKRIGIIGAMQIEVDLLQQQMTETQITRKAGMDFFTGYLCDAPVVIVKSGAGKVNSALCAQILIDIFDVGYIINTGVAGSLNQGVDFFDVVISAEVCFHDMDVYAMGYHPGEPLRPGWILYEGDRAMIQCAEQACKKVLPPGVKIHKGRIVTGDWFINSRAKKEAVISGYGGLCTEMEGAAIGQCAYLNGVPFVVIRSISDKADDSADVDFHSFEGVAAERSALVVQEMVRNI